MDWTPFRRTLAVALSSVADVINHVAFEVMPAPPKRVRKPKAAALEDRPGWYDRVEPAKPKPPLEGV